MNIKRLLFLGFLFMTGLINAQTDFRPGYIIKATGDTLFGEIDYRGDLLMGEVCRFRVNDKEDAIKYSPDDIVAYRFNESKYYVSKEVNGERVFLEFLFNGKINIYYFRDDDEDHYFLEKDSSGIVEVPYKEEIIHNDSAQYLYKSKRHIGILTYYMQDAPELKSRIANFGRPEHKNLIKLAADYHNTVCKGESCIVYKKSLPLLKLDIELTGGITNHQRSYGYKNKNYFQVGALAHCWIPRLNEKLFFRTGLLYSTLESYNNNEVLYKIPVQVEYIYPRGIICPKFAYGITFYNPYYQTVSMMGGFNIRLEKSVYCNLNYDIDFVPGSFQFYPDKMYSQSFLIGIQIKL